MDRNEPVPPVMLSVLDRLIDNDPKSNAEESLTRAQSLRQLKAALKRDLEWLLNTRRTIDPALDSARETARSVYNYGFADLCSKSVLSDKDQSDIVREMETAIAIFEPRLKRIQVRMEVAQSSYQTLRFIIDGLLIVNPAPE